MPRGKPKKGAFLVKVWFEGGGSLEWTSHPHKRLTNEEIVTYLRDEVVPALAKGIKK